MNVPFLKRTLLAQAMHYLYKPFFSHDTLKKYRLMMLTGALGIITQPTLAASFPAPGQSVTYTSADNLINGATEAPLILNNEPTPTVLNIDGTELAVQNFVNGTVIQSEGSILNINMLDNLSAINFSNNNITNGNVMFVRNSNVTIGNKAIFTNNTSTDGSSQSVGGVIASFFTTMTIGSEAIFDGNTATGEGSGGIFNFSGSLTLGNNARFTNNSTEQYGGAIYISSAAGPAEVTIGSGAQFLNNRATEYGGAIYNRGSDINFNLDSNTTTLFENNQDEWGKNSIAFGFDAPARVTTQTGLSNDSNTALLDMRDPMRAVNNSDDIIITKNDGGVWALGGTNNLSGSTQFFVNAGTLYLYAQDETLISLGALDSSAAIPEPTMSAGVLNLNSTTGIANFTLASNAALAAGGTNAINLGAGNIVIGDNATIRGGSQSRSLGGSTPRNELGGNTSLTLTSDNNTQLQGLVNLQALEARDAFTLNANLVDAPNAV
ncbi:MAG TPA: hypothetical protein DEO98_03130, partial [Legionellales bacterium]|nr:hypothetical protein [Legionellales bacterium]